MILFIPPPNLIISYLETVAIALAGPVAKPGWSQSPGPPTWLPSRNLYTRNTGMHFNALP